MSYSNSPASPTEGGLVGFADDFMSEARFGVPVPE
jgi:hypothetical protein